MTFYLDKIILTESEDMSFYNDIQNVIQIKQCSKQCICNKIIGHEDVCEVEFAGFSKKHNYGIKYNNSFFVERFAQSWDGKSHLFGFTVLREDIIKSGEVLKKLKELEHPNLLRIKSFCDCSVEMEYINGELANAKKDTWLLGPRAGERDFASYCSKGMLMKLLLSVGQLILFLHEHGICHTDPTDHNILVDKNRRVVLIDLLSAMPYTVSLCSLDNFVFLRYCVISLAVRMQIKIPDTIKKRYLLGEI